MDHQLAVHFVVVVKARLVLRQDEVRLEADHVVEEAPKLVDLTADDDVGPRVLLQVGFVLRDLRLEQVCALGELVNLVAELEDGEEVLLVSQGLLRGDPFVEVASEGVESGERLGSEVLRRRLVLLDALQVLNREEGLLALLVNDRF